MNKLNDPRYHLKILILMLAFSLGNKTAKAQSNSWPVPAVAEDVKNPVQANSSTLKNGKALYIAYCSPCHGNKGKGDGPASASLHPKPADHTSATVQAESDGTLFYKISEGHAGTAMPPFKSVLGPDQRWAIIDYMRTLGGKH